MTTQGLRGGIMRTVRALRFREDLWRLAKLARWTFARDRVVVPTTSPGPSSRALAHLLGGDDRRLDVGLGAGLIALEDDPSTDVERILDQLDAMALTLRQRLAGCAGDPASRLATFNRYFFEELGFSAVASIRSRYSDDRLADLLLPQIVQRRRGHCLGLSSAYLALGYRARLPLFGVSAPGHFFVRWDGEGHHQNVELTARGAAHPDAYYVERFRISETLVDRGVHLQNLRRREVLVEILNNRANIYWDRGDEARATRDLDRVVWASRNFARAYAGRGFIALHRGDLPAAKQDLERALEIDPDYARAHLLLGQTRLRGGWLTEAIASLERATELDGGSALAATWLGRAYAKRGDVDRALSWHERAVKADPRCVAAWRNLGRVRATVGETEQARAAFLEAKRLAPSDLAAAANLVLLDRHNGQLSLAGRLRFTSVCRDYERALTVGGTDPQRLQFVRFLLGAKRRLELAFRVAKELATRTETPQALEALARVELELGRTRDARETWERAWEIDRARGGAEAARLHALERELNARR